MMDSRGFKFPMGTIRQAILRFLGLENIKMDMAKDFVKLKKFVREEVERKERSA